MFLSALYAEDFFIEFVFIYKLYAVIKSAVILGLMIREALGKYVRFCGKSAGFKVNLCLKNSDLS